ncbi:MAG: DUF2235 domain-containing protein [Halieaceae bacterium]
MAKNLIFCFDGTCNEPGDASQSETRSGGLEDSSISNILKLHLLLGGDLKDGNAHQLPQLSLYYSGVGTYGNKLKRIFNAGLALTDVGRIIDDGLKDLRQHYQSGDKIFVFGFSRGAAIARRFCSVLSKTDGLKGKRIAMLGVFDTVASIGMPDLHTERRPASDVIFEDRFISPNIKQALHLISLDDKRRAFQPTLMNAEERVTEVWFAGAHSDVGGGLRRDGLSDNALRYMLDELARRKTGLVTLAPSQVKFAQINASDKDVQLELDDLIVEPNTFGISHEQSRIWPLSEFLLYDRRAAVLVNDKVSAKRPQIHHTVAERIYGDDDYRPASLKAVKHEILYPDNTRNTFNNLGHHIQVGMRSLRPLKVGESRTVPVYAHQFYNRTGLLLEKGQKYRFKARANQQWKDGGIDCDASGWDRDHPEVGWIKDIAVRSMEPFRRLPDADWFSLIGAIGDSEQELFEIANSSTTFTPGHSDEFCPFANDLKRMYANNDGYIDVTVTRLA